MNPFQHSDQKILEALNATEYYLGGWSYYDNNGIQWRIGKHHLKEIAAFGSEYNLSVEGAIQVWEKSGNELVEQIVSFA